MNNITMKEVIIGIVVIWFQIYLTAINAKLTSIEVNVTTQMVQSARMETTLEKQGEDYVFLRTQLGEVDTKLSSHIEETTGPKNKD